MPMAAIFPINKTPKYHSFSHVTQLFNSSLSILNLCLGEKKARECGLVGEMRRENLRRFDFPCPIPIPLYSLQKGKTYFHLIHKTLMNKNGEEFLIGSRSTECVYPERSSASTKIA
jgi:hypothetical protein